MFLKKLFSVKDTILQYSQQHKEDNSNVDLDLLHFHLLEMYNDVQLYCEQNDLEIFAVGGTALGAIRHRGFIPWDDDIDLGMLRGDYQKFIHNFDNSFLSQKYILKAPNKTKNNPNRFLQLYKKDTVLKTLHNGSNPELQMLFLDIFPYDSVSKNKIVRIFKGIGSDVLMLISSCVGLKEINDSQTKAIFYSSFWGKINYHIRSFIGLLFSFKKQSEWFDIVDRFVFNSDTLTPYITSAMGSKHYLGEIIKRDTFMPLRLASFEELNVYIPNKVEDYLTMLYGKTYMEIPKVKYTHSVIDFRVRK